MSSTTPDPTPDPFVQLKTLLTQLTALDDLTLRTPVAGEQLSAMEPESGAFVLDQLVRLSLTGDPRGPGALMACVFWLMRNEHAYQWTREVYEYARLNTFECTPRLLLELPPHRTLEKKSALRQPRFERDVSLGERKQFAAGADRNNLERLLLDSDPSVIRKLLRNPSMQKDDVITIATRRPTVPAVLREVALSPRWLVNYDVRRGLIHNPYIETGLALKLLPFLHGTDIRRAARSTDLHPAIIEAASHMLVIRSTRSLRP